MPLLGEPPLPGRAFPGRSIHWGCRRGGPTGPHMRRGTHRPPHELGEPSRPLEWQMSRPSGHTADIESSHSAFYLRSGRQESAQEAGSESSLLPCLGSRCWSKGYSHFPVFFREKWHGGGRWPQDQCLFLSPSSSPAILPFPFLSCCLAHLLGRSQLPLEAVDLIRALE